MTTDQQVQSHTVKVVVVGPVEDDHLGSFHVHREGCADLVRDRNLRNENHKFAFSARSRTEVCDEIYPPSDFECQSGEYLYDLHFAPCTDALLP